MRGKDLVIATLGMVLVASAAAQHGQGSRGGQQGQTRGSTAGQQQQSPNMGQQAGGQGQTKKVQASQQQRQQLQTCTASTERLRNRIRKMSKISAKQPIPADQAKEWLEQLRLELQALTQNQEELNGTLTEEQKSATKEETKTIQDTTEKLDQLSDAVEMELALETPDPVKVKQTAQKMESEVSKIRNEQRKMESVLTE